VQHAGFHADIDVALGDARHFQDDVQRVLILEDVSGRHEQAGRNGGLLFFLDFALALNLQFLR
jgi:hypothetical protein